MKVLITAGPTREPIDTVRYISNRSSGQMGISLANAAAQAGHDVTLLLGPVDSSMTVDDGCKVVPFESAADLLQLLESRFADHDVLIMAAAVADYRPAKTSTGKLSRKDEDLSLTLEPVPDLVATIAKGRRPDQRVIAFSLEEPTNLIERATAKMHRKGVDAIIANPLKTMDAATVDAVWITPDAAEQLTSMSKPDFAKWVIERTCAR